MLILMLTQSFMTQYFKKIMNIKNNLTNIQKTIFFGVLIVFGLLINYSCEEDPSALGSNLLPDSDKVKIYIDSSLTFKGRVFLNDPILTSNRTNYTLGAMQDEYFGKFEGTYVGQFLPQALDTNVIFYMIDSVVLYVQVDSVFGTINNSVNFNVYEINETIIDDSSYYSNEPAINYYTGQTKINSDSYMQGDSLMAFPLYLSFGSKLKNSKDYYRSDSVFIEQFKGISIAPELIEEPGGVLYSNLSSSNSRIVMYYKYADDDSLQFSYYLYKGDRFAQYNFDYSSGKVNEFLNNSGEDADSLLFIHGINGVVSSIQFNNYMDWKDDSSYSIINAELELPVFYEEGMDLFYPPSLYIYFADTDSSVYQIDDVSSGYFNGSYNEETKKYNLNISRHFMRFINGDIKDSCLNFGVLNNMLYPQRVMLKTGDNIKFKVTYTKH
mgnify:CR=1 FL=1